LETKKGRILKDHSILCGKNRMQSTFDHAIHHLTPYPTNPKDIKTLQEFRDILQNSGSDLYLENVKWCTDLQLVRFLVARKYDIQKAHEMIMIALEWRSSRRPDQVEQSDGWALRIETEIITGKIYLPGKDQYDRYGMIHLCVST
jgi:hypothetical protein